ncbi:DTW domain-containing protein [Haematococcus lacustris]
MSLAAPAMTGPARNPRGNKSGIAELKQPPATSQSILAGPAWGKTFDLLWRHGLKDFDEWHVRQRERQEKQQAVVKVLEDPDVAGVDKQHRRCVHILEYRRTLFSCPNCWMVPALCVCRHLRTFDIRTKLVVHMHHTEWGRCSNTGCVATVSLPGNAERLIKGHREHDARLEALMHDPTYTVAVLWPGSDAVTPNELKRIAQERSGGRIAVVAVDANWDGALRMKCSYPKDVLYVKVLPEAVLRGGEESLLRPLRHYRGDLETNGRVSTLEAIAALLGELEEQEPDIQAALCQNLRIKVDAALLQKHRPPVYGSVGSTLDANCKEEARQLAEAWMAKHSATAEYGSVPAEVQAMLREAALADKD